MILLVFACRVKKPSHSASSIDRNLKSFCNIYHGLYLQCAWFLAQAFSCTRAGEAPGVGVAHTGRPHALHRTAAPPAQPTASSSSPPPRRPPALLLHDKPTNTVVGGRKVISRKWNLRKQRGLFHVHCRPSSPNLVSSDFVTANLGHMHCGLSVLLVFFSQVGSPAQHFWWGTVSAFMKWQQPHVHCHTHCRRDGIKQIIHASFLEQNGTENHPQFPQIIPEPSPKHNTS